jgi:hypothetical protein
MQYQQLSDNEYSELWDKLHLAGKALAKHSERHRNPLELYSLVDDIMDLKTKLQRHFIAVELEEAAAGE